MKEIAAVLLAIMPLLGARAFSATVISTQSGNWSAPSTWGGNPAPQAGDAVVINGNFTVTLDVSNAACLNIQLGGTVANTGKGTLVFTSGSRVTVSGMVAVGSSNNQGSINMAGGGTLACQGFVLNSLGTWTPGTGTVELTATNTLPNNGITSFNDLTVSGGTTSLAANLSVTGNLNITLGAALDGGAHALTVTGDWTNDGTFAGNAGTVIFARNGNQTIRGSGTNNFNLLRVNMGTSNANILEVASTNFSAPDGFLTLSNGTFKVSGVFTFTSTFILGPIYNIQPSAGLWINNPNVTVTAQAGGVSVRGILRLTAGTYNIGTAADNNLDYVAGSSIVIEGGVLTIAGHLGRNSPASTTSYNQSGGIVTVVTQGSTDLTNAGFDLGAAGSSFTMSGGALIISNPTSNATDYLNIAGAATVTGGTLQIGNAGTLNAQTFRIQSPVPIGNLLVSNATPQPTKPTAQLSTSSLTVLGGVVLQSGTALNANGLNMTVGGDWSSNGSFTAGPLVTFNGSGAQGLTTSGGESFNGLTVNKSGGTLTLGSTATVNGAFSLLQGTFAIGANTLTVNNTVIGGGTLTAGNTGTVRYNQGTAGQSVLAASYGNLVFSDFNKTLPGSGTIGIAGTFGPGTATGHSVAGSTIDFNGGSQSIPPFNFNNLLTGGSGTKTATGDLTVNGNLTVNPGTVFSDTGTINLLGPAHTNGGTLIAGTVAIGPGASLTNNGTLTAGSSLTGGGTLTQGAAGVLKIGGTVDIATLIASTAGNTVEYTGNGQTLRVTSYHHLTLSGAGSPVLTGLSTVNGNFTLAGTVSATAPAGMVIGGSFTIGAGASFDAGSFSHSVKGNWNNAGTFIPGSSTITLDGTGAQTMSASTFAGLAINNAAGVTMSGNATITASLTLTGGPLAIGAHTLILDGTLTIASGSLGGGGTSTIVIGGSGPSMTLPGMTLNNLTVNRPGGAALGGDVAVGGTLTTTNGSVTTGPHVITLGPTGVLAESPGHPVVGVVTTNRNIVATTGIESFGNIGVDLALNGAAPGSTDVLRRTGTASTGNSHASIQRYFDIAPTANSGLNAGLIFHYDTTEVNGQKPATLELYRSRDNGVSWNNMGGIVNTVSRTITLSGISEFSRWTAADTNNSIGATASPTVSSINPLSRSAGDPSFVLTVNGTEFVNGKSVVLFNGNSRTTTYVSSTVLTATIPAGDLLVPGAFAVTVATTGGGTSNARIFTVTPGAPSIVRVETAPDGSGTIVPAQSLPAGSSITVYSIARDSLHNFVANIAADTWLLQDATGGINPGDLVPAIDRKSAVFTGHATGGASIRATSGSLPSITSGALTITPAAARKVRVETLADGSGIVVPSESLAVGSSITVYSITRDSLNNFVANVAASTWSLQNIAGGVAATDLVAASDNKSAMFTAHAVGSATINVTSGSLAAVNSGTITVRIVQGVDDEPRPVAYELKQNYPNPFNPSTTIRYALPQRSLVQLTVYNALGQEIAVLVQGEEEAGFHDVRFDATGLSSGAYFYRIQSGKFVQTRKFLLVR